MVVYTRRHTISERVISVLAVVALVLSTMLAAVQPAAAAPAAGMDAVLSIVDVSAPAINCIFDLDCTITVSDLADHFLPPGAGGDAFLQSRTWPAGEAGTSGAGLFAYLYRIDLRNAVGITALGCVTSLAVNFGPVTMLDYNGDGVPDHVFVVTKGGLGNIKPSAAMQTGSTITFLFDPAVCAGSVSGGGDSSFFFGLASTHAPQDVTAQVQGTLGLNETLDARAPRRPAGPPGCYEIYRPEEIPTPALIDFDELPDAATIASHYQPTYGVTFYAGADTTNITYADRDSDPTKARSTPNVAINDAVWPATSENVPMTFWFDTPKTHVGFFMGNGDSIGPAGAMVGYDAAGNVICQITNTPVPEEYKEFIGMYDPAGRIARITLNYGATLLNETIDDLYFAPFDRAEDLPLFNDKEGVAVEIAASTNEGFSARFDFPLAQFLETTGPDQVKYTQFLLPAIDPNGSQPGLPDVPVYRRILAVPHGATPRLSQDAQVAPGDEITVILRPSQPSPADQENGDEPIHKEDMVDSPFVKDEEAYASDADYPPQVVDLQPMGQMRDLDIWQLSIAGGQYNPAKGVLRTFDGVSLDILFEGGDGGFLPEETAHNPFEQSFDGIYAQALNHTAIGEYLYKGSIVSRICWGHELIIVTDPAFRPAADTLRIWKIAKGISTVVLETGNDPGDVGTTNSAIRDVILNRYQGCLVRPSYVLLLGDAEHIPPFYRSTVYGDLAGTDLDYSLMTAGDIVPDLAYGRIPVDTLSDAQAVVAKIVAYEQTPPFTASFYSNVTVASYFQCCRPDVVQDGTDSRSFVETSELVRNHLLGRGYTVERIYHTDTGYHSDPTKTSFYNSATRSTVPNRYYNGALLPADLRNGSGFAWDGDSTDVINAFNGGRFLIMHRDHGGISGWGDPSFSSSNLASLSNSALTPVVYSINCASGLWDNETRNPMNDFYTYNTAVGGSYWAERLLRLNGGGAVGVIGDTRNSPTWANSALMRGLLDATWPNLLPTYGGATSIRRLGDILNYGKAYMVSQVGMAQTAGSVGSGEANTNVALYHVLGDPTLEMWTGYPYLIKLPLLYELLKFDPTIWELAYPVDGAVITALQDGNPVARGSVQGGQVVLHLMGDGSVLKPDLPVQFVASQPDGIPVVLEEGQAPALGQAANHVYLPAITR